VNIYCLGFGPLGHGIGLGSEELSCLMTDLAMAFADYFAGALFSASALDYH